LGAEHSWSGSRYLDVFDEISGGAWFRLGNRPVEGRAEPSVCVFLPDGRAAVAFERPAIVANGWAAGGLRWSVLEPIVDWRLTWSGRLRIRDDPRELVDSGLALVRAAPVQGEVVLLSWALGLAATLGADQDQLGSILLPGQALGHYQQLAHTKGTISVGGAHWAVDG
jgi:hypothetical protein